MIFTSLIDTNLSGKRYIIHQGGTSSTKTWTNLQYLACWAAKEKIMVSIVAETLPHLKKGALRDFKKIISDEDFQIKIQENKSDINYTFPNGAIIEFFSVDNETKVRGARRDVLFINECNNVPYETFREMDVRTSTQTILDFNPSASFWVHEKLMPDEDAYAKEKGIEPTYAYKISTWRDAIDSNGVCVLPQSIIEGIERRKGDEAWYRVMGLGQIGTLEGIIFQNFKTVPVFPTECKWTCYGLDFGFTNDPTTLVKVGLHAGELYLDEIFYQTGLTNSEISGKLKAEKIGFYEIIADSAEPKSVVDLRRAGWNVRGAAKGPDSVVNGIQLIKDYRLNVTTTSLNLIKELRNYQWMMDKATGKYINKPRDEFNHCIDAARYAAMFKLRRSIQIL